jgi:oligopeptidase B
MNRRQWLAGCALAALGGAIGPALAETGPIAPPITPKRPRLISQLGRVRIDDYAWLKPMNWQQVWRDPALLDPTILRYLQTENDYSASVLSGQKSLEDALFAEMSGRTAPEPSAPAATDGPWDYFTRYDPGAQHPRYLRRPAGGGPEQLLLDAEARANGKSFLKIVNPAHSPDHRYFAWAEDETGAEKYRIFVKDLKTGAIIADAPIDAFGDFTFSPDSNWLFWTWRDERSRPARIYRRPSSGGPDTLAYEETDPAFLLHVGRTASNGFVVIRIWNDVTSEARVVPAATPEAAPRLVEPRREGVLYSVDHWDDRFVILTNADGAVDFKIMIADPAAPGRVGWRELVPHRPGRFITEIRPFAGYLVRIERIEGNPVIVVRGSVAGADRTVAFGEAAYTLTLLPSPYSARNLDLSFESPRTPKQWLRVDIATGQRHVLAQQDTGPGCDPTRYELLRLHAKASDGALIPITLLRKKGSGQKRTPLMLTGYGSYGYSYETGFSVPVLSLVDRGWGWAVAHVRGGSEKGRAWFEAARTFHKKTSFTDFIACAEHLVAQGHTRPGRIAIHGFSAGGLLVGTAANMRPDLWGAVIGQAPFVDMLNTMSDATHPLVPLTRPVWGDPLADPAAYDYIASYSPYENVGARNYPSTLATTAVGDDRVGFWEPAKWIARLREKSTSGKPMLLHVEIKGGHSGGSGRFEELRLAAKIYAFAMTAISKD